MALTLTCDGCECALTPEAAKRAGRLAPAFYCAECETKWDAHVLREQAEMIRLVTEFESWRKSALETMRGSLKRLPDDA